MSAIPTEDSMQINIPPARPISPKFNQNLQKQPINGAVKPQSPILKPARPAMPRYISSSSTSSDDDTPPPRPVSPKFHVPAVKQSQVRKVSSNMPNQSQPKSNQFAPSSNYKLDDLSDLVTARLTNQSGYINSGHRSRSISQQHQDTSRPYTPQQQDNSRPQSRSRMSQFGHFDSRSTTPLLSKQNSFNNFGIFSTSTRDSYDNNNYRGRNSAGLSSECLDDSDYGAYQISRDFIRTPSVLDERALSRIGSTSYFDDNDYSAFTPDLSVHRKMSFSSSVCSTPLQTPKLNRDFGFVSNKKDLMPKPPRRRSKDASSRPVSRQDRSSSRESTPTNIPVSVKSPVRPSRIRGRNYAGGKKTKTEINKPQRPHSLQEKEQEPVYEILTPAANTFHSSRQRRHISSSSDSESDFKTPQASPKFSQKHRNSSSIYEDIDIGLQSYQNFVDNPLLKNKNKSTLPTKVEQRPSSVISKGKVIPPRTSQDPIPTPRQSRSLTRSRDQSIESLNSLNSLPRKIYPKKKEPHYKIPPHPRPVNPQAG